LDLGPEAARHWSPLVAITGGRAAFEKTYPEASQANVVEFLAFDDENPHSIVAPVATAATTEGQVVLIDRPCPTF
jgi:uncharacterized alpha-E superfamily protein